MYRSILKELNNWKQEEQRKVLLIRGARQVGKTYIVREFGQSFEYFIEVNFDETAAVHSFFEGNLDPDLICENLSAYYGIPVKDHKTLVFFDEVQACQGALRLCVIFTKNDQGYTLLPPDLCWNLHSGNSPVSG